MKKTALLCVTALIFPLMWVTPANAGLVAGISLDQDGVKGFYVALGEYYHVPESDVSHVRGKHISDDELPVVFFLAARARVAPGVIVDLRLGGSSWWEISAKYGIGADVYYVPLARDPGPPYGKAYGHYKNKSKKEWTGIVLSDADVVNFVNLRFASDHYGMSPDEVASMRAKGQNFVSVHDSARKAKRQKNDSQLAADNEKSKQTGNNSGSKGKKK